MDHSFLSVLCGGSFLFSIIGTYAVLFILRKYRVMDIPNARSNHVHPTPRGGGIAVIVTILVSFVVINGFLHPSIVALMPFYASILLLALVSFCDDMKTIAILWRFAVQIIAVIIGVSYFPVSLLLFQGGFPPLIDHIIMGIIWLWFINLYNFMDGIDGITGSETVFIGIGVALMAVLFSLPVELAYYGVTVAFAALGFLLWNWPPAKIFMGDVGSVPLGFITGWLLLRLAVEGFWAAALIIPAYYLIDSTVTLLKRVVKRKRFWESHSEHFYQQAVRSGSSHALVTGTIIVANGLLLALALVSAMGGIYVPLAVAGALLTVGVLLFFWQCSL